MVNADCVGRSEELTVTPPLNDGDDVNKLEEATGALVYNVGVLNLSPR